MTDRAYNKYEYDKLHRFANDRCPRPEHFCDGRINLSVAGGVDIGVCQYRDNRCKHPGHPRWKVKGIRGRKKKG